MKLMTKELEQKFPPLYSTEQKKAEDIKVVAKFFDPCGSWTWFATEYDPEQKIFFGVVKGFETEMGYFSLDELESFKGRLGLGIERDMHFGDNITLDTIMKTLA